MTETFLAKGKRGHVFLRDVDGRTVLVKRKNPRSAVDTLANEARFTALLNGVGVGPAFISYDKAAGELVRAYVDGQEFRKWLPSAARAQVKAILLSVLRQCGTMDAAGVDKEEMTRPWKHIIVTLAGEAVLIDFERCRRVRVPKNVTQFCQFLASSGLSAQLKSKNIMINTNKLLDLAKLYKQNIGVGTREENSTILNELMEVVKDA